MCVYIRGVIDVETALTHNCVHEQQCPFSYSISGSALVCSLFAYIQLLEHVALLLSINRLQTFNGFIPFFFSLVGSFNAAAKP